MTTRQPKGIPVGGQFAATGHSESDISLEQPTFTEYNAPIAGDLKLNLGSFDVLPEWPATMPKPEVTFDFSGGKVYTYVDLEPSGGLRSMRFWTDELDGTYDSTEHGENPWEDFDEEDQEAARAYGKAVHERIDASTYGVMLEATLQGKVREMILAHATGQAIEEAKQMPSTYEQLRDRADEKFVAAQRALRDQDRLSMAALSAGLIREFPTATELRVTQKIDKDGIVFGHRMSSVRDGDGNILVQGDEDTRLHSRPGDRGLWNRFHDIRKDFFESKHPDMEFGFFDYDQEAREIIVPLDRDYTEGIEG